ncbi:MAG: hypothetical protein LBD99_05125 [Candidatus Margulisbacteria bacterium]|jgi:DNA-binding NtrC family response regulator|nr:hypothetical protein [Candidatus Margulisiibacteriota bacterium]
MSEREIPPYFCGHSAALRDFWAEFDKQAGLDNPLFIYGAPGSGKYALARALHRLAPFPERELAELDLGLYAGQEAHIWTALKNIFQGQADRPRCSTVYVQGLASADILFLISILEWLAEQKTPERIRALVAVDSAELLQNIPPEFFAKYGLLEIPELGRRLADLPLTVDALLAGLNSRYGTDLKYLDNALWDSLFNRGWSGNIDELRYNLEAVIFDLPPERQHLTLADFPAAKSF